jgi:hypothetical protein
MISDDGQTTADSRHASEKLASHCCAGGTNLASCAVSSGEDRCGWVKDDSPSQPMLEAALNILPNTVYGGGIFFLIIQGLALDICWEDPCLRSLIDPSLPFIHRGLKPPLTQALLRMGRCLGTAARNGIQILACFNWLWLSRSHSIRVLAVLLGDKSTFI